jgi:hypothetical protein
MNDPRTLVKNTCRRPAVWVGVLGTALVGWGGANAEFTFDPNGWPDPVATWFGSLAPQPFDRIMIVLGTVALTWAWWQVRPTRTRPPVHAGLTLLLWSLPLLLAPPVLSPDVTLYADIGYQLSTGHNPYLTGLAQSGGPYADQVDPLWAGSGVAYPPLSVRIMQAMTTLAGFHPYYGYIAMRIPVLLSVLAMLWLVPRIADLLPVRSVYRRKALWMAVLNPLLVLHLVGGGHNDAAMIAVSLFAIWLVLRRPGWWMSLLLGPVVVAVAMALKQQGGLTVVAVAGLGLATSAGPLRDTRWFQQLLPLLWRTAVATVVTLVSFIGICFATGLGLGWLDWLDLMGKANTPAPLALLSKLGTWLVGVSGGDAAAFARDAGLFTTGILAAVVLWIFFHYADRPLAIVAWGALAVAVLGQAMHPWYLPWGLAMLGLIPLTRAQRRWVYGLALAFTIWNAIQTVIWHGQP